MIASDVKYKDLLVPVYKEGQLVYKLPSINQIKQKVQEEIKFGKCMISGDFSKDEALKMKASLLKQ